MKSENPSILCVIHHRHNPTESTSENVQTQLYKNVYVVLVLNYYIGDKAPYGLNFCATYRTDIKALLPRRYIVHVGTTAL
jgi:hypothetical protein